MLNLLLSRIHSILILRQYYESEPDQYIKDMVSLFEFYNKAQSVIVVMHNLYVEIYKQNVIKRPKKTSKTVYNTLQQITINLNTECDKSAAFPFSLLVKRETLKI